MAENNVKLLSLISMLGTQGQGDTRPLTVQPGTDCRIANLVDLLSAYNILR